MIRRSVSAVLQLRDGLRGQAVDGAGALFLLDGMPSRPVVKPGGFLIWVDLPEGAHTLTVALRGYLPETVQFTTGAVPVCLNLKPDPSCYRMPAEAAGLTLTCGGTPPTQPVWLCPADRAPLKLAQDAAEPGAQTLRLYSAGSPLPMPGVFLIADAAQAELVTLQAFSGGTGTLAAPLTQRHSRGQALLPAQRYLPNADGVVRAWFGVPGAVAVYAGGAIHRLTLAAGENTATL